MSILKRFTGFEWFLIVLSLIFIGVGFEEAYRVTMYYSDNDLEQLAIFQTNQVGVPMISVLFYTVVYVKYRNSYNPLAYATIRTYLPMLLALYMYAYLIAFNIEFNQGIVGATPYDLFFNYWLFGPVSIIVILSFGIMFYKNFRKKELRKLMNVLAVVLALVFLLLFSILISDSMTDLGVFDYGWQ